MTPVDIGDAQETLQAKKTFETLYKRPETLIWVNINVFLKGIFGIRCHHSILLHYCKWINSGRLINLVVNIFLTFSHKFVPLNGLYLWNLYYETS